MTPEPDVRPVSMPFEELYGLGHALYGSARYEDAAVVFGLLTHYEPGEARYWFARAAATQETGRFEEAVTSYVVVARLDLENPWPLVHLGECLLLDERKDVAILVLRSAIARAGHSPDNQSARHRAEGLIRWAEVEP